MQEHLSVIASGQVLYFCDTKKSRFMRFYFDENERTYDIKPSENEIADFSFYG